MNEAAIQPRKRTYNPLGAAHVNPRDAYRDVPILKQPTWNNEVAAYFFFRFSACLEKSSAFC